MIKDLLITMRPKQWYKNLVIFIGIVFSLKLLDLSLWVDVIAAFAVFCVVSGCLYIINDIIDVDNDKNHPKKCNRPIASGKFKTRDAWISAVILLIVAFGVSYLVNVWFLASAVAYFLLILIYSLFLKQLIIVDMMVISVGFVIRAIAGCAAVGVIVSPWLIICAFLLSLFLAIGKRRHELVVLGENAGNHRKILDGYSTEMLDQMMNITTSALIMSYSIYTFNTGKTFIMVTIPFAFYGLFRYIYMVHAENFGGEPEMLFKDKGMILSMVLWAVLVIVILYGSSISRFLGVF